MEYFGILSPTKSQHFFVCLFGEHMYGQNLHIMIYTHSSVISIIIIPSIFVLMLGKGTWQNASPFTLLATETMFLGYTLAEGLVRVLNVAVWHKEAKF